jgi:hypothetical protein
LSPRKIMTQAKFQNHLKSLTDEQVSLLDMLEKIDKKHASGRRMSITVQHQHGQITTRLERLGCEILCFSWFVRQEYLSEEIRKSIPPPVKFSGIEKIGVRKAIESDFFLDVMKEIRSKTNRKNVPAEAAFRKLLGMLK